MVKLVQIYNAIQYHKQGTFYRRRWGWSVEILRTELGEGNCEMRIKTSAVSLLINN
jgi:hypothetical protein